MCSTHCALLLGTRYALLVTRYSLQQQHGQSLLIFICLARTNAQQQQQLLLLLLRVAMRSNALIPYPCNDFAAAPATPSLASAPSPTAAALLRLTAFAAKKSVAAKVWSLS